ncbi:MAG: peptidylprolyl isomerase [Lachnospiraceae bacterium]|nr:peptidylprolyl isomerase [Lachnospiraceae bacterium]
MSESNVVIKVKDYTITEADVDQFIDTLPPEQKQYAANPMFREQMKQQLVALALLSEYGKEEKLEETPEYEKLLESAKRDILAQLAVKQVISAASVSDDEIKEFYEANKDRFKKGDSVSAKHILVDDEALCNEVKEMIEKGDKTFEEAALAHSTCPSKERGGDLGEFGKGQMVPEFEEASFAAEIDALVGPVKTQFGYHLIKVYDKKEAAVAPLEEVKDQIKANLLQQKQGELYNEKLNELHKKYAE